MHVRTVLTITAKDLRQRVRDRSALVIMFVVPIGLAALFNVLFGGLAEGALGELRVAVVDQDRGEVGTSLVDVFLPAAAAGISDDGTSLLVEELDDPAVAREQVETGQVGAAILLPGGTSADLRAGRPVTLDVVTSAEEPITGQIAASMADQFLIQVRARQGTQVTVEQLGLPEEAQQELLEAAGTVTSRVRLDASSVSEASLDIGAYLAAGMAVFFLFFVVQFGVLGYLEERQSGTLQRLFAAPMPRWTVGVAKALTSFVVGCVSVGTLLVAAVPMFGVSWGPPLAVAALVVAAVTAATSLVVVVVAFARTPEQANTWQSAIGVVLGMLGGSFFPITSGPALLQRLSDLTPHAWFLEGLETLQGGGGFGAIGPSLVGMLGFALALVPAGVIALRSGDAL